jgi:adenosylhomocysteine nucleosidase
MNKDNRPRIAIMSAMHEEIASLIDAMDVDDDTVLGGRHYYIGTLFEADVVVVFAHWGKVAAAITTTCLVTEFKVDQLIFTGVAGAIDPALVQGDVIIANHLYQHDLDVRPILPRHEIPLLGRDCIATTKTLSDQLEHAAKAYLMERGIASEESETSASARTRTPMVKQADVASGDQFISDAKHAQDIAQRLPSVACVEMEGAAVAQVCDAYDVPFGVVRTISDAANSESEQDFSVFIEKTAREYSLGIVRHFLS